jgi:hypothetical protein
MRGARNRRVVGSGRRRVECCAGEVIGTLGRRATGVQTRLFARAAGEWPSWSLEQRRV